MTRNDYLKVGIIQVNTKRLDLTYNANQAEKLIRKCAKNGAEIVCTSECMLDGYAFDQKEFQDNPSKYCISQSHPLLKKFCDLAEELSLFILLGASLEEVDVSNKRCGIFRNTAIVINAEGKVSGKYNKMHSTYGNYEASFYSHGENAQIFQFKNGEKEIEFGIMICYDRQMPETARMLAVKGAKIIFNPVATGNFRGPVVPHWNTRLMRTRAYENDCFIISVNHASPRINGHSLIVDPKGRLLKVLSKREQAKVFLLDLNKLKSSGNHLLTRRPTVYREFLAKTKNQEK